MKCAEEQKKRDPARASGKVIMRWNVTTAGRPTGISCQTPELCGSYFTTCVTGVIRSMQFPRTRVQGDPINFPLSF